MAERTIDDIKNEQDAVKAWDSFEKAKLAYDTAKGNLNIAIQELEPSHGYLDEGKLNNVTVYKLQLDVLNQVQ